MCCPPNTIPLLGVTEHTVGNLNPKRLSLDKSRFEL